MTEARNAATILVVEDDRSLNTALAATLKAAGFRPVTAVSAQEGLRWFAHYAPELVLLDLGLPDRDGLTVIGEIRARSRTPIVVLSARSAEAVKVEALDLGADDYVQKPFGVDELLARIRAGLRHAIQARGSEPVVRTGELEIDFGRRAVMRAGVAVGLTPKRYCRVLRFQRAIQVMTKATAWSTSRSPPATATSRISTGSSASSPACPRAAIGSLPRPARITFRSGPDRS